MCQTWLPVQEAMTLITTLNYYNYIVHDCLPGVEVTLAISVDAVNIVEKQLTEKCKKINISFLFQFLY